MYKISGEVIKFIENTMEKYWVKLTAEGKSLTDVLSPLLFIIAMMPHHLILRKCIGRYKLTKSRPYGRYQTAKDEK